MARLLRPTDAREAQRLRQQLGAASAWVGGGTVLQLAWGGSAPADLTLIAVEGLAQAQGITAIEGGLRLGAATRLETLRRDPQVRAQLPLLAAACESLAALSVRHLATLGGNVGWRWGDTLAALLVLEARAEQADGKVLALQDWLALDDAPLLVALHVPQQAAGTSWFEKVGHRAAFSPTRLALAVHDGRVAATAAGWPARRLTAVERLLQAQALPTRAPLAAACAEDFNDPVQARLAARLLHGHLSEGAA